VVVGFLVAVVPHVAALLFGRRVLKMNPVIDPRFPLQIVFHPRRARLRRFETGVVAFRIITRREGYRPLTARRSIGETLGRERMFRNLDTAIGRRRARREGAL